MSEYICFFFFTLCTLLSFLVVFLVLVASFGKTLYFDHFNLKDPILDHNVLHPFP